MQDKLNIKGTDVIVQKIGDEDFISITDIARYKNKEATGLVISHWLSTKYTIEFMGLWEQIHNKDFNVTEFRNIKNEAGSHGFILSSKKGNANISQLVCLSNLENLNAIFINEGFSQAQRLKKLNLIAIGQMKILLQDKMVKKLK